MSPSRNESISKSFAGSRGASPFPNMNCSIRNFSIEPSFDNISPKVKKKKYENFLGFEWLQQIKLKLPSNMDLLGEKISEFRDGEILCKILEALEAKNIKGFQKAKKGSAAAVKNVSLAFDILRSKPAFATQLYFAEAYILAGNGYYIRLLLKEIYKIYRSSILTLLKFNGSAKV